MKKIKKLLLACLSAACLTGCGVETTTYDADEFKENSTMTILCQHLTEWKDGTTNAAYFRDELTDIIYVWCRYGDAHHVHQGISVYYNKSGVPMKYDEFQKTHDREYHKDR